MVLVRRFGSISEAFGNEKALQEGFMNCGKMLLCLKFFGRKEGCGKARLKVQGCYRAIFIARSCPDWKEAGAFVNR